MGKSVWYNLHLCIGFIDYRKAFDTAEHFAIFEALRTTNIGETYVKILQKIYSQATARICLDILVSDYFPINRGVRQGTPFHQNCSLLLWNLILIRQISLKEAM